MFGMQTITVKIKGNGKPEVEANGFVGGACKNATKPILDALGAKPDNKCEVEKPELHQFGDNSEQDFLTN